LAGQRAVKPWIASQLYGVGATEPAVIAVVAALITLVAIGAISAPAWRASGVDPVKVLGDN
jgi:ABC-type antimicrobial peptide transport system permease subunit